MTGLRFKYAWFKDVQINVPKGLKKMEIKEEQYKGGKYNDEIKIQRSKYCFLYLTCLRL